MDSVQEIKNNPLLHIGLIAMFLLPLLPSNLKSIAIAVFGVFVLINAITRKLTFDIKLFLINSAVFFVIAATMLYSDNTTFGIHKLEQFASFLAFPFIFALTNFNERQSFFKDIDTYLWVFLISVFLFNTVAFIGYYFTRFPFDELLIHFHTLLRVQSGKFNIHPIYLSMHCGVAILFSLYLLRKNTSKMRLVAIILMDIVLIAFLLLYAKKGPIIALFIILTLFVLFQQSKKYIIPYILVITGLVILIISIPNTRDKFIELFKIESLDQGNITSTNIRYTIYKSAQELITESPIMGYGVGDYKDQLINKYVVKKQDLLVQKRYNAHNQYFSLMLIGGLVLLLIFLSVLAFNLLYAIRFDNQILILLLILYGIVMFTENILEREQGIIFFAFFFNFFTLKSLFVNEED